MRAFKETPGTDAWKCLAQGLALRASMTCSSLLAPSFTSPLVIFPHHPSSIRPSGSTISCSKPSWLTLAHNLSIRCTIHPFLPFVAREHW